MNSLIKKITLPFPSLPHPSKDLLIGVAALEKMKKQMGAAGKKFFQWFQLFDHSSVVISLPDLDFSISDGHLGNGGKDCAIPITAGNVHHKFPTID